MFRKLKKLEKSTKALSTLIGQTLSSQSAEDLLIQDQLNSKLKQFYIDDDHPFDSFGLQLSYLLDSVSEVHNEYHDRYSGTKGREKNQEKHEFTLEICEIYEQATGKKPTYNNTSTSGESKPTGPFVRFLDDINSYLKRKAQISHNIARDAVKNYRQGKKPRKIFK